MVLPVSWSSFILFVFFWYTGGLLPVNHVASRVHLGSAYFSPVKILRCFTPFRFLFIELSLWMSKFRLEFGLKEKFHRRPKIITAADGPRRPTTGRGKDRRGPATKERESRSAAKARAGLAQKNCRRMAAEKKKTWLFFCMRRGLQAPPSRSKTRVVRGLRSRRGDACRSRLAALGGWVGNKKEKDGK